MFYNVKTISQSPSPQAASLCETSDRLPRGMRTYARYTELDRLQTILMTVSSTLAAAADVAAPMRKPRPEYGADPNRRQRLSYLVDEYFNPSQLYYNVTALWGTAYIL